MGSILQLRDSNVRYRLHGRRSLWTKEKGQEELQLHQGQQETLHLKYSRLREELQVDNKIEYLLNKMIEQDAEINLYKDLYRNSLTRVDELKEEVKELRARLSSCAEAMEG